MHVASVMTAQIPDVRVRPTIFGLTSPRSPTKGYSCAFPSWPSRPCLDRRMPWDADGDATDADTDAGDGGGGGFESGSAASGDDDVRRCGGMKEDGDAAAAAAAATAAFVERFGKVPVDSRKSGVSLLSLALLAKGAE